MEQTDYISSDSDRAQRPRKRTIVLLGALLVLCLAAAALVAYMTSYYPDADTAGRDRTSTIQLPVEQGANYLAFGDPSAKTGIVFYPGAKVEYSSYAPLMRDLAKRGYLAVVVQMPLNFAFFNVDAADDVRDAYPQVRQWWVGGHSLGGSMAAHYAADHATEEALKGIVLLGAYTASDLSATDLGAIIIYGSEDGVLNRDKLYTNEPLLPKSAITVEIPGGNHADFGNYGRQYGDGGAYITPAGQRAKTTNAIDAYITAFDRGLRPPSSAALLHVA